MLRRIFTVTVWAAVIAAVLAGTVFSGLIRQFYPGFSGTWVAGMAVFLLGTGYAVTERSIVIGILTLLVSMTIPIARYWFLLYWPTYLPWLKHIIAGG